MKKIFLILSGFLFLTYSCKKNEANQVEEDLSLSGVSSEGRRCAADEILQQQMAEDPKRAARLAELEERTREYLQLPQSLKRNTKVQVPVVVHVVLPNPDQVTDAQIASQIKVLNDDFQKKNAELSNSNVYLAGYIYAELPDCLIEFKLDQVIRETTTVTSFGTNDAVKRTSSGGSNPVHPKTKLNMWVCDLSRGLLGYAQFPGGNELTDGVVIDYQAFGTAATYPMYAAFNKGRTATHEVGHWLNLRHIWGDSRCGNDEVIDTPSHDSPNSGCPSKTLKSACTGRPLEQWMNYMDYTDDRCMYMFSAGQKGRMDAAIASSARSAYFTQL
jgi:hypothetical protein